MKILVMVALAIAGIAGVIVAQKGQTPSQSEHGPLAKGAEKASNAQDADSEDRDEEMAERDEQYADLEEKMSEVDEQYADRDEKVAEIDERYAERDEEMAEIDEQYAERDEEMAERDQEMAERDQEREEREQEHSAAAPSVQNQSKPAPRKGPGQSSGETVMNRALRTGLIMTVAVGAAWAQDYGQTPPPPAAPAAPPRIAPAPRAVVAPEPPEPPEALEPMEAFEPMEPLEPMEPFEPMEPLEPVEALEPPEPGLAPRIAMLAFAQTPPPPPAAPRAPRSGEDDNNYERGQRDLERNRWDDAVNNFGEVVSRGGSRADGALYWKAYALNKLGRRDEALAAIGQLRKNYAGSRWLDDARALEIEIKQASGKAVNPESADDEELKLMALNSFMNSDPDRALPMLEKLLHSSQSPKIKERALFVLTQSGSPQARRLVVQMAKGGSNPDLQMAAVHYLGVMGAHQELGEVYAAANDAEVKRAVLHGLMVAGAKEQLFAAAKGEKNADLRQQAIHWLGTMGAEPELWQLYQTESSVEVKRGIMHALFIGGKSDHLVEIAKTAKEPELRQDSIHWLGVSGSHQAGDALAAMYASETDANVKKQIIQALFVQNNGRALVEIARKETNIELKKEIVHRLSVMKSKEGTDYLLELLNK